MRVELVKINKTVAEEMLKNNDKNRNVKPRIVAQYVADMLKGQWKENTGELIKISKTNRLLDGQHRLMAIIKADIELTMYVAFELEDSIFDVLDIGAKRSDSDIFTIAGAKYASIIPSIIRLSNILNDGGKSSHNSNSFLKQTSQSVLKEFNDNEDYYINISAKSVVFYHQFAKIMSPSLIGSFIIHFNSKSSADCELFFSELCTGQNVTNQVIYLLRNKLIEDRTGTSKMDREHKNALIIKAWNFYRLRQDIKVLRYNKDVEKSFPIAI